MLSSRVALTALLLAAAALPAGATDVERRVKFDAGRTDVTIKGTIGTPKVRRMGEVRDRYIVRATKGQTMTVTCKASKDVLVFVWHGDYNQGYVGDQTGTNTRLKAKLPATDDYMVDVEAGPDTKSADYTLSVDVR